CRAKAPPRPPSTIPSTSRRSTSGSGRSCTGSARGSRGSSPSSRTSRSCCRTGVSGRRRWRRPPRTSSTAASSPTRRGATLSGWTWPASSSRWASPGRAATRTTGAAGSGRRTGPRSCRRTSILLRRSQPGSSTR
ncbi:MAG: FIG074102: hypothetical protein, partial [uncultured Thermomicrobiales bacterium]